MHGLPPRLPGSNVMLLIFASMRNLSCIRIVPHPFPVAISSLMKPHLRSTQRWTSLALLVAAIILLVILASIALVSLTYHDLVLGGRWALNSEWLRGADPQARAAALGQLGDYFGGTLNPILSFCGFLVLLVTVVLQRRQLEEGTRQAEQSTRAIDLEAFVRVHDTLNSPDGLAARARLLALAQSGDPPMPFNEWTPDDQIAAHTVARQFELVGLLIEGRLFDPNPVPAQLASHRGLVLAGLCADG